MSYVQAILGALVSGEVRYVVLRLLRLPTFLCVSVCLGEVCLVKAVAFSLSGLFLGVLSSVKAVE